jgi:HSP20 family protein
MSTITRRNQNWLPSIFNEWLGNEWLEPRSVGTTPAINVKESKTEYKVEVAAPGMCKEDFNVGINENGDMVITMECKCKCKTADESKNNETHYLRREFAYTKFQQTMLLPEDVDREQINATMDKGILCITIPKKPEMAEHKTSRQIEIK